MVQFQENHRYNIISPHIYGDDNDAIKMFCSTISVE